MNTEKVNRERLIEVAADLFRTRGYHHTSMSDIASACNIKKPSLYHHISSREGLLVSVLEHCHKSFSENLLSIAYDQQDTVAVRLRRLAEKMQEFFIEQRGRCLIGKLVHEIADTVPVFNEYAKAFFDDWVKAVTSLLSDKFGAEDAERKARESVSQIQGALLVSQLYGELSLLDQAIQRMMSLLD